jgi:hypothetical protein
MVLMDSANIAPFLQSHRRVGAIGWALRMVGVPFPDALCYSELQRMRPTAGATHAVVPSSAVGRWLRNTRQPCHYPLTLTGLGRLWQGMQREWVKRLAADHVVADTAGHPDAQRGAETRGIGHRGNDICG